MRTLHSVVVGPGAALFPAPPAAPSTASTVEVVGEGFLRHMVRIIVGTLVEVGLGRVEASGVTAILASRARERAGPTAPSRGLFLVAVDY